MVRDSGYGAVALERQGDGGECEDQTEEFGGDDLRSFAFCPDKDITLLPDKPLVLQEAADLMTSLCPARIIGNSYFAVELVKIPGGKQNATNSKR